MDLVETELCDYLQVRHTKLEAASPDSSSPGSGQQKQARQPQLPSKFYKVGSYLHSTLYIHSTIC